MIHIYLNNTEVFPEKDTSIKIIMENPKFSESGTYTLDVDFPMSISENVKLFGQLSRKDVSKLPQSYDLEVRDENVALIVGKAIITKVSDEKVTTQFLAGNSEANYWMKANDMYIDEMDFNTDGNGKDIVEEFIKSRFPGASYVYDYDEGNDDTAFFIGYRANEEVTFRDSVFTGKGYIGQFCFASYIDTANVPKNMQMQVDGKDYVIARNNIVDVQIIPYQNKENRIYELSTPMPNLMWVIRKVIENMGYEYKNTFDIKTSLIYSYVFIASPFPSRYLADALPHWTAKKFIEEVQKFMNCTFHFDDLKKECTVTDNKTFEDTVELKDIVDEYECNISEEVIFTDDVAYKEHNKWTALVGEDFRKKYRKVYLKEGESLGQAINRTPEKDRYNTFYIFPDNVVRVLNPHDGSGFAVDRLGPVEFYSEKRKELEIVPAELCTAVMRTASRYATYIPALKLNCPMKPYLKSRSSVLGMLTEGEEENFDQKQDYMQVFMNFAVKFRLTEKIWYNGGSDVWTESGNYNRELNNIEVPFVDSAEVFYEVPYDNDRSKMTHFTLALKHQNPICNPAGATYYGEHGMRFRDVVKYNGNTEYVFKFLAKNPPNVRNKFIIHGKSYACRKIEYNITNDGIDQLMVGYFAEIL